MIPKNLQDKGLVCFEEITDYSIITDEKLKKRLKRPLVESVETKKEKPAKKKAKIDEKLAVKKVENTEKKAKKPKNKKKKVAAVPKIKKTKSSKTKSTSRIESDVQNDASGQIEEDWEAIETKMSAWSEMMLPKILLKGLHEKGFFQPTPIQKLVIPEAIKNRSNIIGTAQTGSGKTLAFGLPILTHLVDWHTKASQESSENPAVIQTNNSLQALILTPTRELAIQIKEHLQACARYARIKIAVVVGGISQAKQERLLSRQPDIVVATPGRLVQLIDEGNEFLNEGMARVRYFVIDEADRMIEKGHFSEMQKILGLINQDEKFKQKRENFLFSATLITKFGAGFDEAQKEKSEKQMKREQRALLNSLVEKIKMVKEPKVFDLTTKAVTAENLVESKIFCQLTEKDAYLYYFMSKYTGRTLVFANSIDCVRRLSNLFRLLNKTPLHLHANLSQKQRLKNLEKFYAEENSLLIASDVASRGLDIPGVMHVIHYQIPRSAEIYVHRSGRTARVSNEGLSVMLVSPDEMNLYNKIVKTFKNEKDIRDYPIDRDYYNECKSRVSLARKINDLEHRSSKVKNDSNWYRKHAKMLDIELDDEILKETHVNEDEVSRDKQKLVQLKQELKRQLGKPIYQPRSISLKYPNTNTIDRVNKLNESKQNAITEMKSSLKKSNKFLKNILKSSSNNKNLKK